MEASVVADAEARAIELIVRGMKAKFALLKSGLCYTSRTKEYKQIVKKAGLLSAHL